MSFSPATKNGYSILKKCINFFSLNPITLIFPILIIASNSVIFLSILAAEEYYYGVSLFKPETFYNWLSFDISHHFLKFLLLLLILFVAAFINNIFNTALTFYFLKKLNKEKQSLFLVFKWSLLKLPLISYIAAILVIDYIHTILNNILAPQNFFLGLLFMLQGKKVSQKNMMNAKEGMIFLPLIVSNNLSITENFTQSNSLMEKAFGIDFDWNISFLEIKFLTIALTVSTFGFFTHYHYNLLPAIIFSFFFVSMIFIFIDTTLIFFKTCLFNYIEKKPTGVFTKKEIESYFTKN